MDMEIKLFGNNTILITSYNGKIIIDDTIKKAIDAYYDVYGVK